MPRPSAEVPSSLWARKFSGGRDRNLQQRLADGYPHTHRGAGILDHLRGYAHWWQQWCEGRGRQRDDLEFHLVVYDCRGASSSGYMSVHGVERNHDSII